MQLASSGIRANRFYITLPTHKKNNLALFLNPFHPECGWCRRRKIGVMSHGRIGQFAVIGMVAVFAVTGYNLSFDYQCQFCEVCPHER